MDKSKNNPSPLVYKKWLFSELKDITEDFSKDRLIAHGAVGVVYKGFTEDGKEIAVKKFKEDTEEQFNSEKEFYHENIVQPTGYCTETVHGVEQRILCYELLRERSLDEILYAESRLRDWRKRYDIIIGICQGLSYLHEHYKADAIVHMDIKPGNIVLDGKVPKIGSFNQSRRNPPEQAHTFRESSEYTAPRRMNKIESDIYNLGILIMEIVTRKRRPSSDNEESTRSYIHNVKKNRYRVASTYNGFENQVGKCIDIAMDCVENSAQNGLAADEIIRRLETECSSETEEGPEHNTPSKSHVAKRMHEEHTTQRQVISNSEAKRSLFQGNNAKRPRDSEERNAGWRDDGLGDSDIKDDIADRLPGFGGNYANRRKRGRDSDIENDIDDILNGFGNHGKRRKRGGE